MRRAGQPLRFLGWVVGGWIAMRAAVLLMAAFPFIGAVTGRGGFAAVEPGVPVPAPAAHPSAVVHERAASAVRPADGLATHELPMRRAPLRAWAIAARSVESAGVLASVVPVPAAPRAPQPVNDGAPGTHPARVARPPVAQGPASPHRWSAAAWMLWRPEGTGSLAQAPLLGGSQAGVRVDYRVAAGRLGRLGLYGRVSRALTGAPAEEAALGVAFRPGHAPVAVLAERRQRLGRGGRSGFALLVAGGLNPREVAPRLVAEGYAQAGMVGLPGLDGFADGKASLGYRLTRGRASSPLTLGASLSGGVQPGAGRLDAGPELSLRLPAGRAALRLSVEWRERVLGDARPARGPAITLVGDF